MTDLVTVGAFGTREEAEIAHGLLEARGLFAIVPETHQFSVMPHVGFGEGYRLQVRAEDLARARTVLDEAIASPAPDEA